MRKDIKEAEGKKEGTGKIVEIHEGEIQAHVDQVVRTTVEGTLNAMLDEEADRICQAQRYEHSPERVATRIKYNRQRYRCRARPIRHICLGAPLVYSEVQS